MMQVFPETYPLRAEHPDFTCSTDDCPRDGQNGIFGGYPYCQEHLAEAMADEELTARIDTYSGSPIIRLADSEDEDAVAEVLTWAKATGRAVEVSVVVRVAAAPTKRGCQGIGPRHGGTATEVCIAGRDRFLCGWCADDARRYEAEVTRTGVA